MVINMTSQDIFCLVEVLQSNVKFYCTFVYSCNSGIERRSLWKELDTQKNIVGNQPWLVLGNFNVTMDSSEHSSGGSFRTVDMQEFKETMNSIEMEDICSNGFHFTCTKSLKNPKCTILKKLDRILVNESFMDKYPKAFGEPERVSKNINKYPHDVTVKKAAVDTLNAYTEAVKDELGLLKQKAKVNWMKNGDKNIAFFYSILKARKNKNKVERIYDEMGNRFEGDQVTDQFVKHFEDFLGTSFLVDPINADIFTNTLSMTEAEYMVRDVSQDEIKNALFDIDGDKAPGPDGLSSEFFKKAYDIIGKDFSSAVKEFFRSGTLLREINSTLIALIPKCITSSKFSICLNGGIHGYFRGGRGLRQGNKESLQVIKQSLEEFAKVSGLAANLRKSVIFFGSIKDEVYWASVYLLLNTVIKDIDKMFTRFLWNSGESARGKARISWKMVCRPKEQGGLGIKPLKRWNEVLLIRYWGWKTMLSIRDIIKYHVMYEIGKVDSIFVWYDKWSPNGPLGNFITQRNIYDARLSMDAKIHKMIIDNRLAWPNKCKFFHKASLAKFERRSAQRKVERCHLCDFVKTVWKEICKFSYKVGDQFKLVDLCRELTGRNKESKFGMVVDKLLLAATVYYVWQERNRRLFSQEKRTVEILCNQIKECVKYKLMSLHVNESKCVSVMIRKWDLSLNNGWLNAKINNGS
ncbi:RNA-directed DNA polymerase, eukaryota, reverse transcriptase zinc-binding domain protein [Tanacetum coccineum]|uniref:RNA-directed DNA polymerase, eukaryota, reverse transcriptase zinc-binding domain protein n=1 Tax=Tanacetum coccineum TaxID=301880 RepID=A0ABQ5BTD0_9ASTR